MLTAYHNDVALKEKLIREIPLYREKLLQDFRYCSAFKRSLIWEYVSDFNNDGDKICAKYETKLGVPRVLARLENNGIFESLFEERAKTWPQEFLAAIPVGADLTQVWPQYAVWLLVDEKHGIIQYANSDQSRAAIQKVADLYGSNQSVSGENWQEAADAADSLSTAESTRTPSRSACAAARSVARVGFRSATSRTNDQAIQSSACATTGCASRSASLAAQSVLAACLAADQSVRLSITSDAANSKWHEWSNAKADKLLMLLRSAPAVGAL